MPSLATEADATAHAGGAVVHDLGLGAPRRIGPYTITGVLGTGGMGVVYRATQEEPLRREVALKLVRRGLDTERLIARFDAERLVLARMNHSGVARVFDAGATVDGRPYFVMELVQGLPLTEYCDARRAPLRERLGLFVSTCRAVQHAHQKGIVHRDLKPSNILVSDEEGAPTTKVIDFGIAKVVADDGPDRHLLTREGQFVGTPEYMSPEQAGVLEADVDTRTDVYALGVVLYELLAGRKPHRFTSGTRDQLHSVLRDASVARPSTAVGVAPARARFTAAPAPAPGEWLAIAAARQTTPERLRRLLAGDLDTIVLKAMAFEPARRYGSVDQLADDVERYLQGEPVLARPDSWAYRTRKFIGRHRLAVAGAALAAVALIAVSAVTAIQSARVARERDRAEQALARASAVNRFLVDMFGQADPRQALGESLTAEQMLERAATRLQTTMRGEPQVRGELLQSLADVYKQLGKYDVSERLNAEAVVMRRGGDALVLADSLDALGDVRRYAGRPDEAVPPLEEALAIRRRLLPAVHRDVAETYNNLGLVRQAQGRHAEAEALHRTGLAMWEQLQAREEGEDLVALGLTNLGRAVRAQGRSEEAAALFQRALDIRRRVLPANNPRIGSSLSYLGLTHLDANRPAEALVLFKQALAIREATLGGKHPQTQQSRVQVARASWRLGDVPTARREAGAVVSAAVGNPNASPVTVGEARVLLAHVALAAGQATQARAELTEARRLLAGDRGGSLRPEVDALAARLDARP
ncbi:serine/threonine-protein kinase [Luteitalea sp. TBR-22]|uniref:serine/threonine-protein kinase n=1 Tax=Luteitalea sp. TBR-22 TaxID=2802971 RepID=UPI001EF4C633|nr:serine/threonine-protein kinase [Luteitalea sp. TBR-22]